MGDGGSTSRRRRLRLTKRGKITVMVGVVLLWAAATVAVWLILERTISIR